MKHDEQYTQPGANIIPFRMRCCLCGGECEEWPGGFYGHNPQPLSDGGRCCGTCNKTKLIQARLRELGR